MYIYVDQSNRLKAHSETQLDKSLFPFDVTEHQVEDATIDYNRIYKFENNTLAIDEATEALAIESILKAVRWNRDQKLIETDWTQGADVPESIKAPHAVYRQVLRDLPATVTSWKDEVVFPEKP